MFFSTICYLNKSSVLWRSVPYVAWLLVIIVAAMVAYLMINRRRRHLTREALSLHGVEPEESQPRDTEGPLL